MCERVIHGNMPPELGYRYFKEAAEEARILVVLGKEKDRIVSGYGVR